MLSLPLRYQIALVLVGLNVVGTGMLGGFAYRASRESLEVQAAHAVGVVAQARKAALVHLFEERQRRINAFLASVRSLCGERSPSGRFGFENQCVRVALAGVRAAEHATAIELRYGDARLASGGVWRLPPGRTPPAKQIATLSDSGDLPEYTMRGSNGRLALRARFPLAEITGILEDRSGLEAHGEVLLADAQGSFLTPPRYPVLSRLPASLSPALASCLAGTSTQQRTRDYRDTDVIAGFEPIPTIGGGCLIANLPYEDALGSIHRLGWQFVYASASLILIGITLSLMIARAVAQPIARLAESARRLQGGQFDQPVSLNGPPEVRQLERTFSAMAASIGDLLRRERAARLDAETANRVKDDFLAILSHELRTPLNAILGWASIAAQGHLDASRQMQAVRAIERNARTQARLVDELLDVSRVINGQLRLNITDVSLAAVIEAAVDAVRPAAEAKGLELLKHIEPPARMIAGDAHRLQQVVWNLLSNAVRFTPQGGRVEVTLRDVGGQAEIQVTDTGIGIHPDFVPHVFERFRQADSSVTRTHGGLGLGLAIVRHLVELHGGTVGAHSAGEGRGATFTVRLPQRAELSVVAQSGDQSGPVNLPVSLQGTRVLVVDDDADARDVLRTMLEDAGATVTTSASAGDTRAILGGVHPDLLIADIGMPDEDGYSLIRSVRAFEADDVRRVPAIALTAHARAEDVERALASGFQIHVAKPVDSAQLLSTIATLVHPRA